MCIFSSIAFDPTISNSEESSSCTFDRLTCHQGASPQLQGVYNVYNYACMPNDLDIHAACSSYHDSCSHFLMTLYTCYVWWVVHLTYPYI